MSVRFILIKLYTKIHIIFIECLGETFYEEKQTFTIILFNLLLEWTRPNQNKIKPKIQSFESLDTERCEGE